MLNEITEEMKNANIADRFVKLDFVEINKITVHLGMAKALYKQWNEKNHQAFTEGWDDTDHSHDYDNWIAECDDYIRILKSYLETRKEV